MYTLVIDKNNLARWAFNNIFKKVYLEKSLNTAYWLQAQEKKKKTRKRWQSKCSVLALQVVSLSPPKELPVETRSDMVMVTGLVNRGLLSHEILDFCGVLPIYYTKRYTLEPTHDSNNGTASKRLDL